MKPPIDRAPSGAVTVADPESYQTLLARARRRTGPVNAELLVRHVLSITSEADWPVKHEALEARLRRVASAKADGVEIVGRPSGGRILGAYATRRKSSSVRPYRTLLRGVEPIEGGCDCADFLRNSLGLCKHLLAVLADVSSRPRVRDKVRREPSASASPLRWDPVRPLTGDGDWLARVRWVDGRPDRRLERWVRPARGGTFVIRVPERPEHRLKLVDDLLGVLKDAGAEPALHAVPEEDRRRTMRTIQGARDADCLRGALRTRKQRLYPYQRQGVSRFLEHSGSVLSRIEQVVPAHTRGPARGAEPAEPDDSPAEREIEAIVAAADESRDARAVIAAEPAPLLSGVNVQRLFSGLTVERTAGGGLVIAAPPETASTLAALFSGMAQMLQAAASAPARTGPMP